MARFCQRCGGPLNEGDYFCGNCGLPTRLGLKYQATSEKLNLSLSQLERSYQTGHLSKEKYEQQKAKYGEEYSRLMAEISAKRPAVLQNAPGPTPQLVGSEPDNPGVKNSVIYADPPQLHMHDAIPYLIAAVVIVGASLYFTWSYIGGGFEYVWLDQWYLLAFSLVGPAIYLFWMWKADYLEREPVYLVLIILGWGVFAGFLSLIGNGIFDSIGLGAAWLSAPIVEESTKAIGVYLIAKSPEFNDSMDGIVYGFASGMGFAWAENFFYIVINYQGDLMFSLLRVFIFGLGHGIYTAFTGWWLGRAKERKGFVTLGDLKPGLLMAMVAHGIYNSDIIQVDSLEGLAMWVLLTLGTYTVILFAMYRKSLSDEKKWHYDDGFAPKTEAP
jgi:RsiW-degrading membrane proteinase PrsW (M82 family)